MNSSRSSGLLIGLGFVLVACGSTDSNPSGGADSGTSPDGGSSLPDGGSATDGGGAKDAQADGGSCVLTPKIGDPCTAGQVSCDHVDPCCAANTICDSTTSKWKDEGLACFQCEGFKCGTQTCQGGEVCLARGSGIDGGGTSYECVSMPTACERDWSCDCVKQHVPANCTPTPTGACSAQGVHVTLSCMGA
jgi:hypothetical protein